MSEKVWVDRRPEPKRPAAKKDVPVMPEGYYSGDQPNPNLGRFVEEHMRSYDPATDDYDVPPFNKLITATKGSAVYNMHSYHQGKKPHDAIRQYIRHYTASGDLVLDPFCGSGSTALAALMEGRAAIAIDRSPAATFITKNYCTPVDPVALIEEFENLMGRVKPEIDWLYETRCDRCGGKATTLYTVYSQTFRCPRCLEIVKLFDCPEVEGKTAKGKSKKVRVCPYCFERGHREVIKSQSEKFGHVPVLVSYRCENGCMPKRAERQYNDPDSRKQDYFKNCDQAKIEEIERTTIPHWYPTKYYMTGFSRYRRDALQYYNVTEAADLFTKRNLWALSTVKNELKDPDHLLFAFSSILNAVSRMKQWTPDGQHGLITGTYYIPQTSREINVIDQYADKIKSYVKIEPDYSRGTTLIISTDSACSLPILDNSIDYIFTDPPYGDNVQYGELNFVWEAWLGFDTNWHDDEIIVNDVRGKTEDDWARMMRAAMAECYRVLKPGRWCTLCYHDTSEGTWTLVQDIMSEVGFLIDSTEEVHYIDSKKKTFNQFTADKVTKRDLILNFRKPRPGETTGISFDGTEDAATFTAKASAVIGTFLALHPGATRDRIYDDLVSRLVRKGALAPHDFDALLESVAEGVSVESQGTNGTGPLRWYLRNVDETDAAEAAKEDVAFAVMGGFIRDHLKGKAADEGVHYSDLFEHYLYAVTDRPRRELADWLPDYCIRTPAGTWRLPTADEAQTLADSRSRDLQRHVRRYLAALKDGRPIPETERPSDADLAAWIHHCRRTGRYADGLALYDRGGIRLDRLDELTAEAVEEDSRACRRALDRTLSARGV